ncbi:MAG: sigma-54-dependent Fis family transcriptional regulator [Deltaproteobacteria bacterium]|nr:MAG: sigma-54-dependent Fis family transcriptional regulator [Deltaproteobacteria bacterium]
MPKPRVLIIDDEAGMRHMLSVLLRKEGYGVDEAKEGEEALEKLAREEYDFILCDIRMPKMDGMDFLKKAVEMRVPSTIIMMSAYGTIDTAVEAMKLGAYDYISKPFKTDEVLLTLRKAEERERLIKENLSLKKQYHFENIVAKSKQMHEIFETIKKISKYKTTVLIAGESGTGKELVARAIHFNSPRADKPFVTINCGAIPENLLESELFGHKKGSFTGAIRDKRGLFEEADEGSILLDEIGELPLPLQVKLLRVLQEGELRRVGDTSQIKVDVRIIAATVKDLESEVEKGNFREDLFYRLNVINVRIPPLRERKEDIPLLTEHFIGKHNQILNKKIEGIDPEAIELLLDSEWRGNIRELENVVERAMVLTDEGGKIRAEHLTLGLALGGERLEFQSLPGDKLSIKKGSRDLEIELIKRALERTKGNRTQAARLLEISYRALIYKIKEYGIES